VAVTTLYFPFLSKKKKTYLRQHKRPAILVTQAIIPRNAKGRKGLFCPAQLTEETSYLTQV
jgi:hypothetical protein